MKNRNRSNLVNIWLVPSVLLGNVSNHPSFVCRGPPHTGHALMCTVLSVHTWANVYLLQSHMPTWLLVTQAYLLTPVTSSSRNLSYKEKREDFGRGDNECTTGTPDKPMFKVC